ncbi:MAG TPA: TonB-dependent receptor [Steroidobacteraceae bacterium]|jgi:iron complex outermembrane receptor protein|nr:TonB-dependent receptor [Steroidobacteraceae bacterium]
MRSAVMVLLVGPALLAGQARAQSASTDDQALQDVVVTAQRVSQNAQTVPVALSALSADELESRQVFGLQDIKFLVPSLYLEENLSNAGTPKLFMRGIGQSNSAFSFDSPVGIYVDDVYYAKEVGSLVDFFDIDRIEVLRGPQGTIYGRNSSIGAVRVITKEAPLDRLDAGGDLTFGTHSQRNVRASIGAPIVQDKVGFRLSFNSRQNDGYELNTVNHERAYLDDSNALRGQLLTKFSDTLSLTLRGDYLKDDSRPPIAIDFRNNDISDLNFQSERSFGDGTAESRLQTGGASATLKWERGDVKLTSISAWRSVKTRNRFDSDGKTSATFEVDRSNLDDDSYTQEVFVSGPRLGALPVDWIAGAFYLHEATDYIWSLKIIAPPSVQNFSQQVDSLAGYVQGTWHATDRLGVTLGGRYTTEDKDFDVVGLTAAGLPDFTFSDHSLSESKFTWRAAVDYTFDQPIMLYASVGTGFRSGGLNGNAQSLAEVTSGAFQTETTTMYETGIKSDLLDHRLRINAAYFYGKYDNLQQPVVTSTGVVSNVNNTAKVHGLELEARARPVTGLELTAMVSTLNDDIENSNLHLPNAPKLIWNASARYSVPVLDKGTASAGVSYAWNDDSFEDAQNTPLLRVEAYKTIDANLGFETADGHWAFTLAGLNLSNEVHATGGFNIAGGALAAVEWPSLPRRWAFTVRYRH